jgi:hypothetical protein
MAGGSLLQSIRRSPHDGDIAPAPSSSKPNSKPTIDFMPPADGADLVRIVMGQSGRVAFQTELVVRFNYGAAVPWVSRSGDGTINAVVGPERLVLRTPAAHPTLLFGHPSALILNWRHITHAASALSRAAWARLILARISAPSAFHLWGFGLALRSAR